MKHQLFVSIVRSGHNTGEYPAGVRTTLSTTRKEALCDIIDFIELGAGDEAELIDQDAATEDELEERIELAQDEGEFDSWGIDEFELEVTLKGTPAEQIAAILRGACESGDELAAEEILREARGQFVREPVSREEMEDAIALATQCRKCSTADTVKIIADATGVNVDPTQDDLLETLTDEQVAQVLKACDEKL